MTAKGPVVPQQVRVGMHTYRVRLLDETTFKAESPEINHEEVTALGFCHRGALTIKLRRDLDGKPVPASRLLDTVFHEVFHAAYAQTGLPDIHEEEVVAALAPWLLMLLRDNPELVACLTSPLE